MSTVTAPPPPAEHGELEALIEEARRRARRRRVRSALVVAALAGAGLYAGFGGSGGGGSGSSGAASAGGGAGRPGPQAHPQPFPDAPQSQRFATFGRCPLAAPSPYLPRDAGCLTVRRADVDGNGHADLVLLYARLDSRRYPRRRGPGGFRLEVVRDRQRTLHAQVPRGDVNAKILSVRDVNARRGVELFLHEYHVTTSEGVGAYAFDGAALRRAGGFDFDGSGAGNRYGLTCQRRPAPTVVQHVFEQRIPFRGVWDRTDTTYRWLGARLERTGVRKVVASPRRSQVGVHC
jgi:hypothetical protein